MEDITEADARAGLFESVDALVANLRGTPDLDLYRIRFHLVDEPDPRAVLAESADLTDAERDDLDARLARLDRASRHGPWTLETLRLIERRPEVRAGDLADDVGRERLPFKTDVRKLKNLGPHDQPRRRLPPEPAWRGVPRHAARGTRVAAPARARQSGTRPAWPTSQHAIGAAVRSDACAATPARSRRSVDHLVARRLDAQAGGEGGDPLRAGAGIVGHAPPTYAGPHGGGTGSAAGVVHACRSRWPSCRGGSAASGGPGGQHANTADTRAEVRFDVAGSPSLGPRQRRPPARAAGRRGAGGRLRRALAGPQP